MGGTFACVEACEVPVVGTLVVANEADVTVVGKNRVTFGLEMSGVVGETGATGWALQASGFGAERTAGAEDTIRAAAAGGVSLG